MTQFPSNPNSTTDNKALVKGVGYFEIFSLCTNICAHTIELSTHGTSMRRTIYRNGVKAEEFLYEKINNPDEIRRVEESGSEWETFDGDLKYGYIVRGQRGKTGSLNGYYKVVKSNKVKIRRNIIWKNIESIDSRIEDWIYYKRRTARK